MKDMSRTLKLIVLFLALFMVAGIFGATKPDLKNIIIISVDTLRADHLGCYGYPLNTTPNIDNFAGEGILFTRCFSLTPLTTPSFSTMLTSLPPYKHGAKRNGLSIYRDVKTLPHFLKRFGYYCAAFISNWPLRKKLAGLHKDFNAYHEVFTKKRFLGVLNSEGEAPVVTQKAISWLEKNREKKFFLWVLYSEPHRPYIMHDNFNFDYHQVPAEQYPAGTKMKRIRKYDSEIAYTDFYIGKLIKELKDLGLYNESLIIFHSDHGESFGEHNYSYHGRKLYNSTVHVPLIIKLPYGWLKNTRRHENVSILDIGPTIFSVLNIPLYSKMEGLPLFKEGASFLQRTLLLETYGGAVHLKRNNKKYKLNVKPIRYALVHGSDKIIYNLAAENYEAYHLTADPFEDKNMTMIHQEQPTVADLKQVLADRVERISKYIQFNRMQRLQDTSISEKDLEMLKSLGYVD